MNMSPRFVRFCSIGVVNTIVDTSVYTGLHTAGLSVFAANFVSTSLGMCVSFVLNNQFTFTDRVMTRKRIMRYMTVTLCALWVLQPLCIILFSHFAATIVGHTRVLKNVLPKLGSIALTLIWNYLWYSHYVFAD